MHAGSNPPRLRRVFPLRPLRFGNAWEYLGTLGNTSKQSLRGVQPAPPSAGISFKSSEIWERLGIFGNAWECLGTLRNNPYAGSNPPRLRRVFPLSSMGFKAHSLTPTLQLKDIPGAPIPPAEPIRFLIAFGSSLLHKYVR